MQQFFKNLNDEINKHDCIVIIGHKNPDMDCLGAEIGLYYAIEKECYIFKSTDPVDDSIKKAYNLLEKNKIKYINKDNYKEHLTDNTLLIIVDLYRKKLIENIDILDEIKDKIIIDHHIFENDYIESKINYINPSVSSTVEIIVNYLKYENKKVDARVATIMLAGIEIDTNGYNNKTTASTFQAASTLMNFNADNVLKQHILKIKKEDYIKRTNFIEESYTIQKNIIVCPLDNNIYKNSYLATLSEDLLKFEGVEAAFTIGYIKDNTVGISARSLGKLDVEKIMVQLDGGGHKTASACQFIDTNIREVTKKLIEIIKEAKK